MPSRVFWTVTSALAIVGIGLISAAAISGFFGNQVLRELARALGEAFVVAAFIAATVDQYVKHGLVSDIFKYIVGYSLPFEIQDKIKELTRNAIIRRNLEQLYLFEHYPEGKLKLTVEGKYEIFNCSNRVVEHTPHLDFEKHEEPVLEEFRCDSTDVAAQDAKRSNANLAEKQGGVLSASLKKIKIQPQKKGFAYSVSFRYFRFVEVKDSDILSFSFPTIGVVIRARYPSGIVFDAGKAPVEAKDRWNFTGLFLEGQHIHVRWFPKSG